VGDALRRQMVGLRPHETDRTDPRRTRPYLKDGCSSPMAEVAQARLPGFPHVLELLREYTAN
jgi:hypothetical protein